MTVREIGQKKTKIIVYCVCDLPNGLLQKLLEENTKLLTMSESEKKISAVDTAD